MNRTSGAAQEDVDLNGHRELSASSDAVWNCEDQHRIISQHKPKKGTSCLLGALYFLTYYPIAEQDGPLYDCRIWDRYRSVPPKAYGTSTSAFEGDRGSPSQPLQPILKSSLSIRTKIGQCLLTHGHLSFLNNLACGDNVVGIVDGETADWYPYYWKYITAGQIETQSMFWKEKID